MPPAHEDMANGEKRDPDSHVALLRREETLAANTVAVCSLIKRTQILPMHNMLRHSLWISILLLPVGIRQATLACRVPEHGVSVHYHISVLYRFYLLEMYPPDKEMWSPRVFTKETLQAHTITFENIMSESLYIR